MDTLFDIPEVNPINLARALERDGEETRRRMKKGPEYQTNEHKAAKLIRWYVRTHGSATVAKNAQMLATEALAARDAALSHAEKQTVRLVVTRVAFAAYALATIGLFAYMTGG